MGAETVQDKDPNPPVPREKSFKEKFLDQVKKHYARAQSRSLGLNIALMLGMGAAGIGGLFLAVTSGIDLFAMLAPAINLLTAVTSWVDLMAKATALVELLSTDAIGQAVTHLGNAWAFASAAKWCSSVCGGIGKAIREKWQQRKTERKTAPQAKKPKVDILIWAKSKLSGLSIKKAFNSTKESKAPATGPTNTHNVKNTP